MKKEIRNKTIICLVIVFTVVYVYNKFSTKSMIIGKYVNKNYGNTFIGENPHIADTLILYDNNHFRSGYYGDGEYKLFYGFNGTRIALSYKDKYGDNGFTTSIDRLYFFGNLKINLYVDLNQYYEKI
ncbi:hypothetical protein [Flavobacterium subsaxonicum]|uniref:Uncharacterized protein n=1 Tax=Flavobacterium subsaxonicum WB 4.1-42 = DSM 21790 TaxID=1121898 RepID=A0A0A2MMB6_9FLAO|nr:hypothetical protein [Flavobacterium subsaxonicum]KGO93792.1 hypothetical protein Q766_07600 [Flavobacterium subsaxonicum WB 4.1-42 = DSM 21790]